MSDPRMENRYIESLQSQNSELLERLSRIEHRLDIGDSIRAEKGIDAANRMTMTVTITDHLTGRCEPMKMQFDRDRSFGKNKLADLMQDVESLVRACIAKVQGI